MRQITRKGRFGTALLLVVALSAGTAGLAQTAAKPEAKKKEDAIHAVVGGTVLPVAGPPIHRGVVLFQKGKILAVGSEVSIPEGAVVHEAGDRYVTPGLVAIESSVRNASHSQGNFADNLDPYYRDLRIALAAGITTLQVVQTRYHGFFGPEPSVAGGQPTAIIKATVGDLEGMMVKEPSAVYLTFRSSMLSSRQFRENFRKAREYIGQVEEAEKEKKKAPRMPRGIDLYVKALKRETPTIVYANDVESIRMLLDVRRDYEFDLVLSGGRDGWKLASELTAHNVPVMIQARDPGFRFGLDITVTDEDGMIALRRPAAYAAAGVPVILLPLGRGVDLNGLAGRDITALPFEAAFAVRGGMDEHTSLRAITLEPARVLKIADRVGSLEKGKDADLLIWSGHPLHYRSFVETAWINGKVYYERDKSSLFRDIPIQR